MRFDIVSLFPEMLSAVTDYGITGRAFRAGLCEVGLWNPRDFVTDHYRTVDDRPYGGGPGMVMLAEPLERCLDALAARPMDVRPWVVHVAPRGTPLTHRKVMELRERPWLVLIASRYEGVDERFIARRVDEEISLGDFVLSGGEIAAMAIMDAVIRQLPGALNDADSAAQDSFVDGLLDCPHYTRPEVYQGLRVPEVLLSGDHARIARWRLQQSLAITRERRPELLGARGLSRQEKLLLDASPRGDYSECLPGDRPGLMESPGSRD